MIIEKNVKIPEASENGRGQYLALAEKMEAGDSVFVDGAKNLNSKGAQAFKRYFMRRGIKYTSRQENNGVRIWRLS